MNTFDRYLLARYFHVAAVFLIASLGLFAVVDGFLNLDEFQERVADKGAAVLFLKMGQHYLYKSTEIIDLAGPTILVISAMCSLALMLRSGEIHPLLAAGVPTYRLTFPLVVGLLVVNSLLILNQECILPALAPQLQGRFGVFSQEALLVQPQYDAQRIFIGGSGIRPKKRELTHAEFALPAQTLAMDRLVIRAEAARYLSPDGEARGGWLLQNISPPLDEALLTDAGRNLVIPQENGDVFIASSLTLDQLSQQASNHRLIRTTELFRRLQEPTGSPLSRRGLLVHVHNRLTRPLLTLIGLYIVIPLIIRRDRMSMMQQVTNLVTCSAVLGIVFGLSMGSQFLGQSGLLAAEQAVWAPLILGGGVAGWLTGVVRT